MTLAKARAEARKAFTWAKDAAARKILSPRTISGGLINIFWDINRQVGEGDRPKFRTWYQAEQEKIGKEIGAK